MLHQNKRRMSGFTLIELAIVLGVAGILFGGLWRLLSTSNVQMRDQATASQHAQLIAAVSAYLQSPGAEDSFAGGGQQWLANKLEGTFTELKLPSANWTTDTCPGVEAKNKGLCNFLPPGFIADTTNPYGQKYTIKVLKDASGFGVSPLTYSFMILTSGDTQIPDTSGGRISGMIGGDGGFVYSSNVCGTPTKDNACGSYGSWSTLLSVYGLTAGATGVVASRTYYSSTQGIGDWLARKVMPSDKLSLDTPVYNTMKTHFLLGGSPIAGFPNHFYFGSSRVIADSGIKSVMYLQGGQIDLGGGLENNSIIGTLGTVGSQSFINLSASVDKMNALITLNGCNRVVDLAADPPVTTACTSDVLQIHKGNILIQNGFIQAQTFTYSGSDVRLKKDIKALTDPLAEVMKIKPVSFVYKANGKKSMGVIAQDLEKIYPQLVVDGRDGMKSVGYEGLIAPLIGSVQELKKENDTLSAQLRDQSARQEKMEREIERLRRK